MKVKTIKPRIGNVLQPRFNAPSKTGGYRSHYRDRVKQRRFVMLRAEGFCEECRRQGIKRAGSELDHIVPLADNGADDVHNMALLCVACHATKTSKEAGQRSLNVL